MGSAGLARRPQDLRIVCLDSADFEYRDCSANESEVGLQRHLNCYESLQQRVACESADLGMFLAERCYACDHLASEGYLVATRGGCN